MKKYLIPAGVVLLAVYIIAALLYNSQTVDVTQQTGDDAGPALIRDYSPALGDRNAKVTIVEFFDPACEACRAFYPFVKHLLSSHSGKINLVLRYAPFHDGSDEVVKMLEAARLQNKFWQVLEATYQSQPDWAAHHNPQPEKLWAYLEKAGLDIKRAKQDMQNPTIAARLQQDIADAVYFKVTKTPGFFVNGNPLTQFGYEQLQYLVESEIRKSY